MKKLKDFFSSLFKYDGCGRHPNAEMAGEFCLSCCKETSKSIEESARNERVREIADGVKLALQELNTKI